MNREVHVRICERPGVQLPGPTRPRTENRVSASTIRSHTWGVTWRNEIGTDRIIADYNVETGYVPIDALVLLKTKPGAKVVLAPPPEPQKTKMAYDDASLDKERAKKPPAPTGVFTLLDSTPIRVKLGKALSSSNTQVGDEVSFEVLEDVVVDGLLVVAKGALASGVVNEAEPKKSLGRGKLSVLVKSVRLTDDEKLALRSGGEGRGSSSAAGAVLP